MIKFNSLNVIKDDVVICCITVEGHAQYAEKGKDIVCASASAYSYFLIESLINLEINITNCLVDDGKLSLCVEFNQKSEAIIYAFLKCMRDLEHQYPKNVMEIKN